MGEDIRELCELGFSEKFDSIFYAGEGIHPEKLKG